MRHRERLSTPPSIPESEFAANSEAASKRWTITRSNVIDYATLWKIDSFFLDETPFDRSRMPVEPSLNMPGSPSTVSAEDTSSRTMVGELSDRAADQRAAGIILVRRESRLLYSNIG